MGFFRRVVSFFKPPKPKSPPVVAQPKPEPRAPTKTASEIAAEEDDKKKRAIVAANAGSNKPQGLGDTSQANTTKKNLLGL